MARATKQQGKSEPSHSKDRFSSFSHRHGDATGKPATRDKTRGCRKTSISHETSSNFHSWQHDKRRSFAASPIDTARPRENQRRETRQVGAPKRAFRARLPSIFTLCSCKIDVFLRVFLRTWKLATSKSMFRARLPSTFSTSHKMPRLPRNLHLVATWRSPANMRFAKNTQQDTSKVLRLPRKMTTGTSKVLRLPQKLQHIFWKRRKSIAPATQNDFRHVPEHVWMSRSATPATRNEATTRLKPPKRTTSAELPIGTAIRGSRERLRTVAIVNATSSEHTLNPHTPRVKREPLLRIREKVTVSLLVSICWFVRCYPFRGLLCVISGLLAGGSPGFRTVLCCFFISHKSCMARMFQAGCHVVLRGRRGTFWHSTCLMMFTKFQNWRKSRRKCWFFCIHVSCRESLVFLWRRRVYGGSWKTCPIRMCPSRLSCRFAWQAWHFVTFQPVWWFCQNQRKSPTKCSFFCTHVSRLESLVFLWRRRVYGGSSALHTLHFTLHTPQFTLDSTLYTLHSTLYTLHFTLLTPHLRLYTPHSTLYTTLYTFHSSLHTLHFTLHTLHFILNTPHFTLHTPYFTLHTSHSTLSTPHSTLYNPHSTLYTPHSTLYNRHFTLYTPHSTLYTLHFTLYTPHSTLYTLHSTLYIFTLHTPLYTPHSTLYTPHSTLHTPHFTLHTLDSTLPLYTPHSTLYTFHSTLRTAHSTLYCTLHTPHFIVYTPHSTLHTLHSSLYTPHSTLYTPHSTLSTPDPTLYTLCSTLHTLHFTLYTPHSTLLTPHSTLYTPHFTLLTPHFTLHTLHSTLYTLHSTLYTPHSTLYTLHSTLCTLHSTLYTLHSTLSTLLSSLHTLHSTLCTPHSTLYTLHSILHTLHFTLRILHFTHSTLPSPHFTLHTPYFTLHTLHFPLHTADW